MFQPSFRWFRIHPQKKGGKRLENGVLNSTELYRVNRKWEFKQLAGYCNQVNMEYMEKLLSTENGIFSFNIGHVVEPKGVDIRFIHIRIESFVCDGARYPVTLFFYYELWIHQYNEYCLVGGLEHVFP